MDRMRSKPLVIIQSYEDRNSGKELNQTISERISNFNQREAPQDKSTTANSRQVDNVATPPPPPPPLPREDIDEVDSIRSSNALQQKIKPSPPPVPQKTSNQPPPCPTPDYDTLSISSSSTLPKKSSTNGFAKRDVKHSLSYNGDPRQFELPDSNYFKTRNSTSQLQNGCISNSTLLKQRPVSVTIGEYPSGTSRKQPRKLDFLNGSRENNRSPSQSIVSQFASELAQTLNRSNLRKKTESMENLLNHPQIKANTNGSVRISINSSISKHLAKSTNDLSSLDNYCKSVSNRVTINIPSNDKKSDAPNGILKHNNGNHHNLPSHRSVLHQKSITFGEIPTVINDKPLHVT